jgi:ActR/RegA family two-component response regulator
MFATPTFEIEQLPASAPARVAAPRAKVADRPRHSKRRARKVAAGGTCLVISPDALRRLMFGQSAERCGWQQVVCEDAASALEHLESDNVGMVLIDIASMGDASLEARRWLVEQLAERKDVLTVVCGRTSDSQEEIWARQLGVWMYLPGVAPESDLDPMLVAGREISVRMHQSKPTMAA